MPWLDYVSTSICQYQYSLVLFFTLTEQLLKTEAYCQCNMCFINGCVQFEDMDPSTKGDPVLMS